MDETTPHVLAIDLRKLDHRDVNFLRLKKCGTQRSLISNESPKLSVFETISMMSLLIEITGLS